VITCSRTSAASPTPSGSSSRALTAVHWAPLAVGLGFYGLNLLLRSRARRSTCCAPAYPTQRFRWREVAGAYVAAYGANAVFPARPGDVVRLFLLHRSVPNSTYPTLAASFLVENVFDTAIGVLILLFAFTQGVFPKPPDFSQLGAFDLSYLAGHPRLLLFLLTTLALGVLVAFRDPFGAGCAPFLAARGGQGFTILGDRPRYLREGSRPCSSPGGSRASCASGSCSTRSRSAARCATCCSSSASTRSPPWSR